MADSSTRNGLERLKGRVALVTGGARGIGRAIAEAYVAEGAIVGVIDLKQERVEAAVAELKALGGDACGFAGDVSKRETLDAAARTLLETYGGFDILVSNAMWARYQPLAELTEETLAGMVAVGFNAVVWGMQIAEALMGPRGGGAVINIASVASSRSLPNSLVYS